MFFFESPLVINGKGSVIISSNLQIDITGYTLALPVLFICMVVSLYRQFTAQSTSR